MSDWQPMAKLIAFDGGEVVEPYFAALGGYLSGNPMLHVRQLWLQEEEEGEWFLVFTRDTPHEPLRNPTVEELVGSWGGGA